MSHQISVVTDKSPRVSIGLPVHNGAKYLEETLNSFLTQTYSDIEIIISDNASTDQTETICKAFAAKNCRVRYYRVNQNHGAAWNYNRVFELSRGEYFKWAAADDLCGPEMIEQCVKRLDEDPDAVVCYAKTTLIDENGDIIGDYEDRLHLQSPSPTKRFIKLLRSVGMCNAVCGLMRPEVLRQTRLHGIYLGSDRNLLAELSLYGQFIEIPDRLFFRRIHAEAHSSKGMDDQLEFFHPKLKNRIVFPSWRILFEDMVSVKRAPISLRDRVLLFGYLNLRLIRGARKYLNELGVGVMQWLRGRA